MWIIQSTFSQAQTAASSSSSASGSGSGLSVFIGNSGYQATTSESGTGSASGYSDASGGYESEGGMGNDANNTGGQTYSYNTHTTYSSPGTVPTSGAPFTVNTTSYGTAGGGAPIVTYATTVQSAVPTLASVTTYDSTGGLSVSVYTTETTSAASLLTTSGDTDHYTSGTFSTTTTMAWSPQAQIRDAAVIFDSNIDVWQVKASESWSGFKQLSEFGSRLSGGSYSFTESDTTTTVIRLNDTTSYQGVINGVSYKPPQNNIIYQLAQSGFSTAKGLLAPPRFLPNDTAQETFYPYGTTSYINDDNDFAGITSTTQSANGCSISTVRTFEFGTTSSLGIFTYDRLGRITGSSSTTIQVSSSTTAVDIVGNPAGGVGTVTFSTSYSDTQSTTGTVSYTNQSAQGSTFASAATVTTSRSDAAYGASSFLPVGTILEATFDPAVRFGTAGKFDSVDGPNGIVFYPFWSQVWSGLWMPMTYAVQQTTTYQNQSTVTETYDGGSYTYLNATGPMISVSYSWSDSLVYLTTATGSGTDTGSGSSQFSMQAAAEDDASYFAAPGAGLNVYLTGQYVDGNLPGNLAAQGGDYVVGGTQWNDQPAQLWLGSGVWGLTTYQSAGGSQSAVSTITDAMSILMIPTNIVVAARPLPTWECVSTDLADACLAGFALNNN